MVKNTLFPFNNDYIGPKEELGYMKCNRAKLGDR